MAANKTMPVYLSAWKRGNEIYINFYAPPSSLLLFLPLRSSITISLISRLIPTRRAFIPILLTLSFEERRTRAKARLPPSPSSSPLPSIVSIGLNDTFRTRDQLNYYTVAIFARFYPPTLEEERRGEESLARNRRVVTTPRITQEITLPRIVGGKIGRLAPPRVVNNNSFSLREST